ncbi:MAG: ParB/RepB/Spo0J family partition protein [Candidatus Portnoybacteria bacterium]|nr:ParB/RepB/Spo0J family partition protein [Candidatus Portnoybacteria bacterium]
MIDTEIIETEVKKVEKRIQDILRKVNVADIPQDVKDELERKLVGTQFMELDLSLIRDVKKDLRVAREVYSAEVIKSFSQINLMGVSPIIVMKVGDYYEVVDGQTRFGWHKNNGSKIVVCAVIPELTEIAAVALNTILNSKRKNLSEKEQRTMFTLLREADWTDEQIANASNFSSKRVHNQTLIEKHAAKEVKDAIDSGEFSARKIEETFQTLLEEADKVVNDKPNNGIPSNINEQIQIELVKRINFLNTNRASYEEEITRDWLSTHRIDEIVLRNSKVMWRDYTPEQIARSSVIRVGESDFICEHPDKIEAVIDQLTQVNPDWYLGLPSEGAFLYREDGLKINTVLRKAHGVLGKEAFGVGYFEGAKIDDVVKFGIPHYQGDIFVWLNKYSNQFKKKHKGQGVIFMDSFGDIGYSSEPLLQRLLKLFAPVTILFLVHNRFSNRRSDVSKLEQDCWTYWGIDVPKDMPDFIRAINTKIPTKQIWESVGSGQTMHLLRIDG